MKSKEAAKKELTEILHKEVEKHAKVLYEASDSILKDFLVALSKLYFIETLLKDMYYAGHWTCDKNIDEKYYWEQIKMFLKLPDGTSPKPIGEKDE